MSTSAARRMNVTTIVGVRQVYTGTACWRLTEGQDVSRFSHVLDGLQLAWRVERFRDDTSRGCGDGDGSQQKDDEEVIAVSDPKRLAGFWDIDSDVTVPHGDHGFDQEEISDRDEDELGDCTFLWISFQAEQGPCDSLNNPSE